MSREIRNYLARSLGFFVVLELMLVAAIIWWPSFAENVGALKRLAAPVPMLGDMLTSIEKIGVSAYVTAQHYFKGCNTLGAAAAVLLAMSAIAGEAHRGTLESWMARPVSRTRLLTERFVGGYLALALPIFLTSFTIPWLLTYVDERMPFSDLVRCAVHESLFLGSIYSITFLLSAMGSQPLRIAFVMLFFSIFQFAIYMVKEITHYSLFRLADIETFIEITTKNRLDWSQDAPLVATSVACYGVSLWAFRRRVP